MRLKRLRISGFKSFYHPIEFNFQTFGITVIVGPNGCGKSNVVDAIRWVLGEQRPRGLRGSSMEDVIFSGTSEYAPSGMAEVTITFSNEIGATLKKLGNLSEISVSRRLYRSGESHYLLNKSEVRLKDIRELFMETGVGGTGYSIIEQGKVGEMVSARPIERRQIIEDAAGIVKFQLKRQKAEQRLEETRQNLTRMGDLLHELRQQKSTLQEQVEQAEMYLDAKERFETLEKQLLSYRWNECRIREQHLQSGLHRFQEQTKTLKVQKSVLQEELDKISFEMNQQEQEQTELKDSLYAQNQKLHRLESKVQLEHNTLQNTQLWIQRDDNDLSQLEDKVQQFEQGLELLQKQRHQMETKLNTVQEKLTLKTSDLEKQKIVRQEKKQQYRTITQDLANLQSTLNSLQNQQGLLEGHLKTHQNQKTHHHEQQSTAQKEYESLEEQYREKTAQHQQISNECERAQNSLNSVQATLDQEFELFQKIKEALQSLEQNYQQKFNYLESLERIRDQHADFSDSIQEFLHYFEQHPAEKSELGILGVLADFVHIPEKHLEQIAPILGDCLDWIVVKQSSAFSLLEARCLEQQWGRIQCVALDRELPESPIAQGIPLSQFVSFASPVQEWGKRFCSHIRLIGSSVAVWGIDWERILTLPLTEWASLDGAYLKRNGVVTIGNARKMALSVLNRDHEIEELKNQCSELQHTLSEQRIVYQNQQNNIDALKAQKKAIQKEWDEIKLQEIQYQKEELLLQQKMKRQEKLIDLLVAELSESEFQCKQVSNNLQSVLEQIEQTSKKVVIKKEQSHRYQAELNQIQKDLKKMSNEQIQLKMQQQALEGQQQNFKKEEVRIKTELEGTQNHIEDFQSHHSNSIQEIEERQRMIDELNQQLHQTHQEIARLENLQTEQNSLFFETDEDQRALNNQFNAVIKDLEEVSEQSHSTELQLTEMRLQREQWEERLQTLYEIRPQDIELSQEGRDLSEETIGKELKKLKRQLGNKEVLNLGAPEAYRVLHERILFIENQVNDLNQAIQNLKQTIEKINHESRERFKKTFDQINQNFKKVFLTLFGGGDAKMVLTGAEDILEAGVDIIAQPPGKKLQNLNLLSGGEKALTAISLIFGIFLQKPSPFCLLDEVDAPLDDANVGRFNRLIQSLSDQSQFILITHNKKTMEVGQSLFGITMEEPGISKSVSVHFEDETSVVPA